MQRKIIVGLSLVSLAIFILSRFIPHLAESVKDRDMLKASMIMAQAIQALRDCPERGGGAAFNKDDLNRTGLIGLETSSLTTSLGNLEAKRTSTNPNFAGLVVHLLKKAGIERGDTIAVGASSSFPAMIVATLSAAKALELRPLVINSLGASQWGANNPEFTWLEMSQCLQRAGVFDVSPLATALGGENDTGMDMTEEERTLLVEKIKKRGQALLELPDLAMNVRTRMKIYEDGAGAARIKAFVNIGGSWANLGTDSVVLKLKPGLNDRIEIPMPLRRGVIHEMVLRKIPVIHLLFMKGLAEQFGLPWDPVPLPKPGDGRLYERRQNPSALFAGLAGLYFLLVTAGLLVFKLSDKGVSPSSF
jgi:poly-gamma-glutamate system protein